MRVDRRKVRQNTNDIDSQAKMGWSRLETAEKKHIEQQLAEIKLQTKEVESLITDLSKDIGQQIKELSVTVNSLKGATPVKNESTGKFKGLVGRILAVIAIMVAIFLPMWHFSNEINKNMWDISSNVNDKLLGFKDELYCFKVDIGKDMKSVTKELAAFKIDISKDMEAVKREMSQLPQTIIEQIQKIQPQKLDNNKLPNAPRP